ncbi:hypothetical protein RYX36_013926 [Vicia faba]
MYNNKWNGLLMLYTLLIFFSFICLVFVFILMSGNGSNAVGGFLFAQQLIDHTADDGLSRHAGLLQCCLEFFYCLQFSNGFVDLIFMGWHQEHVNLMINITI